MSTLLRSGIDGGSEEGVLFPTLGRGCLTLLANPIVAKAKATKMNVSEAVPDTLSVDAKWRKWTATFMATSVKATEKIVIPKAVSGPRVAL
ncbi:MAG TPA: hypothetical protein VGT24_08525 [Candidatus Acidoferrales bacterium]|nr:hypothetical protein [Candidatus Acidoferrales bacterium]